MPTTEHTNDAKVAKIVEKLLKVINKAKLNIPELLVLYGNLGYHLGASMAGFTGKGPSLTDLKKEYYRNPTVDVGLMIQGLQTTDWEKDYIEHSKLSSFAEGNITEKK